VVSIVAHFVWMNLRSNVRLNAIHYKAHVNGRRCRHYRR
jgi:hypothetical protein